MAPDNKIQIVFPQDTQNSVEHLERHGRKVRAAGFEQGVIGNAQLNPHIVRAQSGSTLGNAVLHQHGLEFPGDQIVGALQFGHLGLAEVKLVRTVDQGIIGNGGNIGSVEQRLLREIGSQPFLCFRRSHVENPHQQKERHKSRHKVGISHFPCTAHQPFLTYSSISLNVGRWP